MKLLIVFSQMFGRCETYEYFCKLIKTITFMRKTLLTLLLIIPLLSFAQELGYRKFLSEGKCWYQHAYTDRGNYITNEFSEEYTYYSYLLKGDTLINGQNWFKLYRCEEDTLYYCAMYEDGRKVIYIPKGEQEEQVLYDFPENPYKFWEYGREWPKLMLMETDTVLVNGNYFRRLNFTNENYYEEDPNESSRIVNVWVEGIGCDGDLFHSEYDTSLFTIISETYDYTWHWMDSCYEDSKRVFTYEDFHKEPITSSISKSSAKGKSDKVVFDLQGRPVVTPQKNGLYIKNGKKFIAR